VRGACDPPEWKALGERAHDGVSGNPEPTSAVALGLGSDGLAAAQPRVAPVVDEVDEQADRHPDEEAHPGLLGALIRPIFNADSQAQARDRLSEAVAHLDGRMGKVAAMLEDAEADILAFYAFPAGHWRKLRSTNPLERFNREVGRRADVAGIFPDDGSLIRLAGMLCIEQMSGWSAAATSRRSRSLSSSRDQTIT
jgi:hypothetical protein